ncbi:MAG: MltA domain-containing protein [Desulfobacterales bacterium]
MRILAAYWMSLFILISLASGCGRFAPERPQPEALPLVRLSESRLPEFSDDLDFERLGEAIEESLAYLNKIPEDRIFLFGKDRYTAGRMIATLTDFSRFIASGPTRRELNRYIADHYFVYQAIGRNNEREVLFTGYFEPEIKGSPVKTDRYVYPVYAMPDDLMTIDLALFSSKYEGEKIIGRLHDGTVVPYYTREEIEEAPEFSQAAEPIAWVQDPVALFFLHVQGSGRVVFEDGKVINVHYHGTNGHAYRSIGKHLIESGKIERENMSMQAIYAYLQTNPDQIPAVLNINPSYVFFETVDSGPLGCIMAELVPGRSIALDKSLFPPAAPAFIASFKPVIDENDTITGWTEFSRFVLNHDTGGAIKGAGRADIFWGSGKEAEITAGHLKHPGKLYFFVLKKSGRADGK